MFEGWRCRSCRRMLTFDGIRWCYQGTHLLHDERTCSGSRRPGMAGRPR